MAFDTQSSDEVYIKCMELELDSQMAESFQKANKGENAHDGDDVSGNNDDHIVQDNENKEGSIEQEKQHEKKKNTHCNCGAAMFMSMRGSGRGGGGRGGGRGIFFGRGAGGRGGGRGFFGGRGGGGSRFDGRGFNETEQPDDVFCTDPRMGFEGIGGRGGGGRGGGRGGGFRGIFDRRFGVEFYEQGPDGLGSFWARPCIAHGDTCNCGGNENNPKSKDAEAKQQKPTATDEEHDSENEDAQYDPPCTCNTARGGRGRGGWGRGGRGGSCFGQDPKIMGYSQFRRGWQGLGARAPFARPQHFPDQHKSPSMTFGISLPPHSTDVRPPFPPQANFEGCRFRGPRPVRPEHGLVR
ncbi:hornerin-like [Anneissia japonica]|uniref:hornerin-like n=1 Tax=Anneissia japonica TaxID=1529436 RepID=UPI001425A15E|nr:hornerin-like [Anneissia japonica]